MSGATEAGAVLYHEPDIITILIQSSFILALNAIDYILDKAIYCGLIGQILIGMAWGTPGANILGSDFQRTITDLGYLGLILIVFEGGLSTDMKALRSNILLSSLVALTGIALPIGLSFTLTKLSGASILQSFAAGCALCSTSLGTTFTILKSSGLDNSRLGTVLTSAAMLDDIVGLVLVQVISNLGTSSRATFSAITVIRPVFVSIAFAALVPVLLCLFDKVGPKIRVNSWTPGVTAKLLSPDQARLVWYTTVLLAAVSSASYAGTSNLFSAYLAGLVIASGSEYKLGWLENKGPQKSKNAATRAPFQESKSAKPATIGNDTIDSWEIVASNISSREQKDNVIEAPAPDAAKEQPNPSGPSGRSEMNIAKTSTQAAPRDTSNSEAPDPQSLTSKTSIYEKYYATIVNRLLRGLFFGSIGLSIPITRLFNPPTLWRGIVFAILMTLGKITCGIWLFRFSHPAISMSTSTSTLTSTPAPPTSSDSPSPHKTTAVKSYWSTLLSYRPSSLYPAGILGNAMVARGEIGFLISAIAQSNGIFNSSSSSSSSSGSDGGGVQHQQGDLFLIVTWAILICTILGPVSVGLLTRRVKRLRRQMDRNGSSVGEGRADPLGIWADL